MGLTLSNHAARRLFLHRHALIEAPTGPAQGAALSNLISRIGFVQVDSINTVERAHHMILFSRRQSYQPVALKHVLETDRQLWEHWTHDASILPVATFPYWKHRFAQDTERLRSNWQRWFREGYHTQFDTILRRIADHGPVTCSDFGQAEPRSKGGWWDWHPSKTALEWLWRTGQLAIAGRDGFQKVYDLAERVIPELHHGSDISHEDMLLWACGSALDQLGFATVSEVQAYWNAVDIGAVRAWALGALARGEVIEISVEGANRAVKTVLARPDIAERIAEIPDSSQRLRVLSPFDPALRDRARAEFLFGFYYRIEVFVPEAKRRWGYYVFPVLQGDRIIGRIDAKAYKSERILRVKAYWPEAGLAMGAGRMQRLDAELQRLARFAGCDRVEFLPGWLQAYLPPL